MDNKDDLQMTVGMVANTKSANKVVKDSKKGLSDAIKSNPIEIPVDITIPIDKTKTKLTKAQKDIVSELNKMMSEGFSASAKDVDSLVSKFKEFTQAFDQAGKGRQNKVFREIRRQVEEVKQTYKEIQKVTRTEQPKIKKTSKPTKTKKDKYVSGGTGTITEGELEADIKKFEDKFAKELNSVSKKLSFKPGVGINPGNTNDYAMNRSEYSSYASNWALQIEKARKEEELKSAKSLVTIVADDLEAYLKEVGSSISSSKKGTKTTEEEFLTFLTNKAKNDLIELFSKAEKGLEDIELDDFIRQIAVLKTIMESAGKDLEEIYKTIGDAHSAIYSDNSKKRTNGTNREEGTYKGVGPGHDETVEIIKSIWNILNKLWDNTSAQERQAKQFAKDSLEGGKQTSRVRRRNKSRGSTYDTYKDSSSVNETVKELKSVGDKLEKGNTKVTNQLKKQESLTETQVNNDRLDTASNKVHNKNQEKDNKELIGVEKTDANDGFNDEANANKLINSTDINKDSFSVLEQIRDILQHIFDDGIGNKSRTPNIIDENKKENLPSPYVEIDGLLQKTEVQDLTDYSKRRILLPSQKQYNDSRDKRKNTINDPNVVASIEKELSDINKGLHESQQQKFVEPSDIFSSQKGFLGQLKKILKNLIPKESEADKFIKANAKEQALMRAEREEIFGINKGKNLTDTGDIADFKRYRALWGNKRLLENQQLFQDVKLSKGFSGTSSIDTTEILKGLNKVLSGPEMFKAQTGGILRNIIGSMTAYVGMPSIEKSRAQAEGLNQVMANTRNEILSLIQSIQAKEISLTGMQKLGTARFDKEGRITEDSSLAAQNTFTKLEEQKGVLRAALAEVKMIDNIVAVSGGRVSEIIKQLKFVMPELMQNNTILHNINAGLDKNGKALKFQSRTAEVLNYSFQLMSRHIGQIYKNWIMQLNPLTQIKKLFSDFMGYNVKWQRTMNVVKYNMRSIFRPFMEWIAQQLVNIIGFFDIISMKVQKAFGRLPVSVFDQAAADSEKINEELEAASNVSAGFDELHDIGSDNTGANDLFGEIYKPQLSKEWEDLANKIGDLFAGIITGDLGFSEVMLKILDIAWSGLKTIVGYVGKFLKDNIWPLIKDNWLEILAWVGGAFLAWKFLKTVGSLLVNALFGKLTPGLIGSIFGKVGGWIVSALSSTSFGQGIVSAFSLLFTGGKYSLIGTLAEMFTNSSAITAANSWGSMIGFAVTKGLLAVLGAYATYKITDFFGDRAVDAKNYNLGLEAVGGDEKDKKSNLGNIAGGILGGAAGGAFTGGITFGLPGAVIGAAIGAIAGTLQTVLRPALEETQVAARNMNNEIQNISYYEGQLQGVSSQVQNLTELQNLMSEAVEKQTDKVYKQGEQLGINRVRLDELVKSTQNGTFTTDLLTLSEQGLSDSLSQLSDLQEKNNSATEKLTEAKKKLQKAEMDLAIAQDVAAGNFELAAARIEVAYASELYDTEEATKKMVQIAKEGSAEQAAAILKDMSPDLQAKFQKEYSTTEEGLKELTDLYFGYSKSEREYFVQNLTGEVQTEMQKRIDAIKQAVENAPWWKRLFDIGNDGKIFGQYYIDVPHAATGTNYVASDGLAYIHKGEAIIPKKYNPALGQSTITAEELAYMRSMMTTLSSLDNTMKQGIPVSGQFVQRGSDLVAVVNKTKSQSGADLLSNVSYAR